MFPEFYPFSPAPEGIHLRLRVTPRAAQNRVGKIEVGGDGIPFLKVYVTSPPEDGKANQALIKLLSDVTGLPKSLFHILKGHADRQKVLLVSGNPSLLSKTLTISLRG